MKINIILLFYFFFMGCSQIGFYAPEKKTSRTVMDWQNHSLSEECNSQPCESVKEGRPFLTNRYEEKPGHLTEIFKISPRTELEILFVVDVSQSMNENLKNLGKNMLSLLSYVSDKNWRIAFTTADHGDHYNESGEPDKWEDYTGDEPRFGKLMKLERDGKILDQFILTSNTSRYEEVFKNTLTRENPSDCNRPPTCQRHNEQPLRALKATISRYKTDKEVREFFQPKGDTVVILVTDEDERREDFRRATIAEQVMQTYEQTFKGMEKRLFGFSISIQDEQCYSEEDGVYGRVVGRLAELTGGKNISLCLEDYGVALAEISKITRSLAQSPTLSKIFYIPDTVQVSLKPEQPEVSWKLYGRKLVFSGDVAPNTEVTVSYRYER